LNITHWNSARWFSALPAEFFALLDWILAIGAVHRFLLIKLFQFIPTLPAKNRFGSDRRSTGGTSRTDWIVHRLGARHRLSAGSGLRIVQIQSGHFIVVHFSFDHEIIDERNDAVDGRNEHQNNPHRFVGNFMFDHVNEHPKPKSDERRKKHAHGNENPTEIGKKLIARNIFAIDRALRLGQKRQKGSQN